jgi:hypothetical protein
MEAEKQGKTLTMIKSRQVGQSLAHNQFLNMMDSQAEKDAKMVLEHFKKLLSDIYLEGKIDASQHAKIEVLLDSKDYENQKLGVKLIEQKSGKTIELVHQDMGNETRETTTRTTTKSN